MATVITEVEVEVTNSAASSETESKEKESKFSQLRRRITTGNSDGTKRPSDSKWRQQKIPACRPVFSAKHVCIAFCTIGLLFIALGITFTVILSDLSEMSVDYTQCAPSNSIISDGNFSTCANYVICKSDCLRSEDPVCLAFLNASRINASSSCQLDLPVCQCEVNIVSSKLLRPDVHVYYSISNYYQNHRRYLNSKDLQQINGNFLSSGSDCRPLITVTTDDNSSLPILPCGLIANSWFNDTFDKIENTNTTFSIDTTDIAWYSDRSTVFGNSSGVDSRNVSKPPNWPRKITEVTDGLQNEALIVWFRVSAFPWFRKLYGRIHTDMPASTYTVSISYSYPVTDFNGGKSVILAEVSWLGGRNLFLGAAYIVVGALLIVAGIALLIVHITCSKWKENNKNFLNRSY